MVASLTPLPVIGIPVALKNLEGVDSLYSICQMPAGVPVATVAINNSVNAALLAIRILGTSKFEAMKSIQNFQSDQQELVIEKSKKLVEIGWKSYP